jgi:transcriptional regulator with XRE-family HTH domain
MRRTFSRTVRGRSELESAVVGRERTVSREEYPTNSARVGGPLASSTPLTDAGPVCRHLTPSRVADVSHDTGSSVRRLVRHPGESVYPVAMGDGEVADGRFASTRQNQLAGRALRAARQASGTGPEGVTQVEFAARLGAGLGIEISASALSNWESGRRSVPTAVLIEAAAASSQSTDALLARAGSTRVDASADHVDLAQQLAEQRRALSDFGRLLARMRRRLEEEGIYLTEPTEERPEQRADAP